MFEGRRARPWKLPSGTKSTFSAHGYYLGVGSGAPLEVAVAKSLTRPIESDVRNLWKKRRGGTPSPLLLIVTWQEGSNTRVSACGTTGDDPAVYSDRDLGQITRLAEVALAEPDHHAAVRFLSAYLPEERGGLRNVALFAFNHLTVRVPQRADWAEQCRKGERLLALRRQQLIEALGFTLEPRGNAALLRSHGQASALAVFLDDDESPDATNSRFNGITPISWAIASATADNIPYVVVTRGPQVRVYTTRSGAGIAGNGGTAAFLELNLPLLSSQDAGYLPLLFSAESLTPGGVLEQLLDETNDFAIDLGSRLRSRVYDFTVPALAQALIDEHDGDTDSDTLESLYRRSLLILFRLLFVAYAEDRDLLPLRTNGLYRQRSLKHVARELSDLANQHGGNNIPFDESATDLWDRIGALWTAVDKGRREWNVPAYNGGMFATDPEVSDDGAALVGLSLTNAEFGPGLLGLLVDETDDGRFLPVDFASLDVREFGTIYEGLLESSLAVAPCDLTIGTDDVYVPAEPAAEVRVENGAIYLHNKGGARKATGSYFTKPFAVNHLLNHALEPALDSHLERMRSLVESGDEIGASEAFFDFRCVDLAMGSGHFLVAAIDLIERRLSEFLTEYRLPGVLDELDRLARRAAEALEASGIPAEGTDTNALLRRQIARRCIYGVDMNPVSVELARLALWIHTFVKGLPLTSLNHGLIAGNSLSGIGILDEALDVLDPSAPGRVSFVRSAINDALEEARAAIARFAATSEADSREVRQARQAHHDALAAVEPARRLLDFAIAVRGGQVTRPTTAFDLEALMAAVDASGASAAIADLDPVHFPLAFPEVFGRPARPGFDCILGNPPWDKVLFEPTQFWVTRSPGLQALSESEQELRIDQLRANRPTDAALEALERAQRQQLQVLVEASFSLRGTGHYDFAKLFLERALRLKAGTGTLGLVLPAASMLLGGWSKLREAVTDAGSLHVAEARNAGGWLFEDVHHSTAVVLLSAFATGQSSTVTIRPCATTIDQLTDAEADLVLATTDLDAYSRTRVVPWLNGTADADVFAVLAELPSLSSGGGWITGRHDARWDFRSSGSQGRFVTNAGWRILQTRHVLIYGINDRLAFPRFADPLALAALGLGVRRTGSGCVLGEEHPLIVVRHPSRNDDSRTLIATALPDQGYLHAKGYAHAVAAAPGTSLVDQLAFLGWVNSFVCDWWARRFVDRHVTAPVVNNLRVPNWDERQRHRVAGLVATVLSSHGTETVVGGASLTPLVLPADPFLCRLELEALAFDGAGLGSDAVAVVLGGFSSGRDSLPPVVRQAILDSLAARSSGGALLVATS